MDRYSETLKKIYNFRGGMIDLRLDRMDRALGLLDHPERQFPSLHIAGTNGKGSTSAILHRILSSAGYRTALYTSPHLVSFTERIRVGDQDISQNEVVELADEIERRTAADSLPLTFFEFVTVMAFAYFAREKVDLAVVEVGLGGRLDATNLVMPLVSAITTISKDHEAYLGSDVLSIAREKGGIIKDRVPMVAGRLAPEITAVLRSIADEHASKSHFLGTDYEIFLQNAGLFDYRGIKHHFLNLNLGLRGRHQRANAAVALAALEVVADRFPTSERAVREGLEAVSWPGRFEVMLERPTVILDGAHNGEGVKALIDELANVAGGRTVKLLFAAMADKEWDLMVKALVKIADEIIFSRVEMERSAEPEQLAESLGSQIPHRVIRDSKTALRTLFDEAQPDDLIVVAGSLYLLGEIRPLAKQLSPVKPPGTLGNSLLIVKLNHEALASGFPVSFLPLVLCTFDLPLWAAQMATGPQGSPAASINVTADKMSAGNGGNQIEATGNVEIKREEMTLKADEVRINQATQDVEAKGKVTVSDPEWKVKSADSMQMNMEKETGELQNADLFLGAGAHQYFGPALSKVRRPKLSRRRRILYDLPLRIRLARVEVLRG